MSNQENINLENENQGNINQDNKSETRDFTKGYAELYERAAEEKEMEQMSDELPESAQDKKKIKLPAVVEEFGFHEVKRKKKVRKKKNYLVRLLVAAGILVCIVLFMMSSFFNVDTIAVKGNSYYKNAEVIEMSGITAGENLFFGVDKSEAIERLESDPYFDDVTIKKSIPGKITITVKERKQIAALKYGETYIILDAEGLILRKNEVDPKITILKGFKISDMTVGELIQVEEQQVLENALAVVKSADEGDFYFKKIDCSRVIFKAYVYDTLPVKGTAKQLKTSIDSGDLQKVVNKLMEDGTKRGTINLGNGNYVSFSPDFS